MSVAPSQNQNSAQIAQGFHNPVRIFFGRGTRRILIDELAGKRVLMVTSLRGRSRLCKDTILNVLDNNDSLNWLDSVGENPGLVDLQSAIDSLSGFRFDAIIAIGGGSVIDTAKVLAVALSRADRPCSLKSMLENASLIEGAEPLLLYALPTTAGTGSEVTPFATVWDHKLKKKYSLASAANFAHMAIIDADLADDLPEATTISTGLDAINQAAESIWNKNANPITIAFATRALKLGFRALPKLLNGEGGGIERDEMAECSLFAGLAISHTRTALCHSISYPLTAHFGVPHGVACAFTMPAVLEYNIGWEDGRFENLAKELGDNKVSSLLERFTKFNEQLNVCTRVRDKVKDFKELESLSAEMITKNRTYNNIGIVNTDVIRQIISKSWGALS